jgi:hypothetical protein
MIAINVTTRLHQISLIFGLFFGGILSFLMIGVGFPPWLAFIGIPIGMIAPPWLTSRYIPRKDEVTIGDDRLTFQRRKPILYSDIERYNTDDVLQLIRRGEGTLRLSARQPMEHQQFRDQFVAAIEAWRESQIAQGIEVKLRRTHFYGSTAAKLLGVVLIVVCVLAGIFVLVMFRDPPYGVIGLLVVFMVGGGVLLSKRGPDDDDDEEEDEDEEEEARRR